MFDYTIISTEYTTGLYKTIYNVRRKNESNIIAYFSFIDRTTTIVELLDFNQDECTFKDIEVSLLEILETYYDDRDYLLLHSDLKESTKFPFESLLNNYTTLNTTYERYQI